MKYNLKRVRGGPIDMRPLSDPMEPYIYCLFMTSLHTGVQSNIIII